MKQSLGKCEERERVGNATMMQVAKVNYNIVGWKSLREDCYSSSSRTVKGFTEGELEEDDEEEDDEDDEEDDEDDDDGDADAEAEEEAGSGRVTRGRSAKPSNKHIDMGARPLRPTKILVRSRLKRRC